jgi:MFS transporter, DHA2 family, multidrug resistance protein
VPVSSPSSHPADSQEPAAQEASAQPPRSALVLLALITGAIVANINLSVANVALPTIGADLGATQDQLTSIANAFALGLASSVLYLGTIGDRYGRKLLFVLGAVLTVPTAMLAAWAWSPEVLILARYLGGIAAALLFPTTLSLIAALYRGRARVSAIALWSGLGGGVAALGPLIGGWLLEYFWWGSVFLITLPLVALALAIGLWVLPWHASEEVFPVDHLGGILSVIGVGGLILVISRIDKGITPTWLLSLLVAAVTLSAFLWRQTRARRPLVSLPLARARTFWVAFVAGAITFGSLIGAMFIGQQFTQNVLGYEPLEAAAVVLPAAIFTALFGQLAGRLITAKGSQFTFMLGLGSVAAAFTVMLVTWSSGASVAWVLLAYALVGAGVGLAATPASRSLMSSVPPSRGGMGSAFLDLTRDFGGAIMQAVMGALLAGAYAASIAADLAALPADQAAEVSDETADALTSSFQSAEQVAHQYPEYATQIASAASDAFTSGKSAAIAVALVMTLVGIALVLFVYPGKRAEEAYYSTVRSADPS